MVGVGPLALPNLPKPNMRHAHRREDISRFAENLTSATPASLLSLFEPYGFTGKAKAVAKGQGSSLDDGFSFRGSISYY